MKETTLNYRVINCCAMILYAFFSIYITIKYIVNNQMLAILGPVSLLFLLIPAAGERLFRLKLGGPLRLWIIVFCFLGFCLGTALRWFDRIPFFDDFAHFLSGIMFSMIGCCLYARLRDDKQTDRNKDIFLQIAFAFFFSMFIAVIWEIGEYLGYLVTGHDAQHTLTTGVHDTMQDMIACVIGSLIMAADFYFLYIKRRICSFIVKPIIAFDKANQK